MSKRIDKEKELREMNESQASLVNALESIHTLLEESETKLSAARESLEGSRIDNKKHYNPGLISTKAKQIPSSKIIADEMVGQFSTQPVHPDKDEFTVPILEDIVIPGIVSPEHDVENHPLFDSIENPLDSTVDIRDSRKQQFIEKVESIQLEMDDYLNEMLVRCMASIELELKETLSKKFQELRDIIESDTE
ncbi:hypothetical protein MNBD_GAMMA25-719 [hydrothermal vent metagenome]|uniref:Uncharacterized protein n=1 Tax=hydrothermal vent metagenome TaxID=652676 RepID=A0A3B1AYI0_9ZZZZ